jgi:tryptophan synthase alpha chain
VTLAESLRRSREYGRCGFVPFLSAGDPTLAATERYAQELARAGADVLELGVPFSDPVADGPAIQLASERALKRGATLAKVLALAGRLRNGPPVVLFTYLNPVLTMGKDAYAKACKKNGVKATLIVDLPAEEWGDWKTTLEKHGVEPVLLASPTTEPDRLRLIGRRSGSVVYYVSREGVTGVRSGLAPNLAARLTQVRKTTGKAVIAGFGIASRAQARALARHCDGVVVGSALVTAADEGGTARLGRLAREIVGGLQC